MYRGRLIQRFLRSSSSSAAAAVSSSTRVTPQCVSVGRSIQMASFHSSTTVASSSSTQSKQSTTSRDTRLAGRVRFYKQVGVVETAAPWEGMEEETTVESPISAGVDGTDSATGVHRISKDATSTNSSWKKMLVPRKPGSSIDSNEDNTNTTWYGITLDGRAIKTPMGQPLAVPSQTLAFGIAAEWNAQVKHLQPANMPLMTLACTTIDQAAHHPDVYREQSLRFLPTDTACFWADPTEDRVLNRRQEEAWKELHGFVKEQLGDSPAVAMSTVEGMLMARKRGDAKPTAGLPHPQILLDRAKDWTHSLDAWHLVALHSICAQAKSFLVAYAVLEENSPLRDIKKAIAASRVEEEFQISNWGLVEGGHDYDRLNCSIQLHSAHLFAQSIILENKEQ